jgi:secreted trypsin-like serine protease
MTSGRKRIVVILAALCLLAVAAIPASGSAAPAASTSVIGGSQAFPGEFPYVAYVEETRRRISCSGSVVAPRVILTAAHCVTDERGAKFPAAGFGVITGTTDLRSPESQVSRVTRVLADPQFSFNAPKYGFGDAALLQLETPTTAEPVPLATGGESRSSIRTGTKAYVAGYGLTRPGARDISPTLIWAKLVIEGTRCEGLVGRLCAIDFPKAVSGTCHGDSGGPLLVKGRSGFVQLGIIHAGFGHCSPRRANLFTRIDSVGKWLRNQIKSLE